MGLVEQIKTRGSQSVHVMNHAIMQSFKHEDASLTLWTLLPSRFDCRTTRCCLPINDCWWTAAFSCCRKAELVIRAPFSPLITPLAIRVRAPECNLAKTAEGNNLATPLKSYATITNQPLRNSRFPRRIMLQPRRWAHR